MQPKYVVIQAFPEGMVAVIRHTIHGLLLAELTNRVPVVLWNNRFLYHNDRSVPCDNGFGRYFVGGSLGDLSPVLKCARNFAPTGWNSSNVGRDDLVEYRDLEERPEFRPLTPREILSSDADVVVYTHYQHLVDLLPLLPKDNDLYGLENSLVARRMYQKYFSLGEYVSAPLARYRREFFGAQRRLGVHCRGSDKITEYALATPQTYRDMVTRMTPAAGRIFLATDSQACFDLFQRWFGHRLAAIDCFRSGNRSGVHFSAPDREIAGRDFLVDAYLLAQCDGHLGNNGSHVSYLVQAMLRTQGHPYDNFQNVEAPFNARLARLVTYRLPRLGRKLARRVLLGQ